jgi:hypothetical protein
MFKDPYMCIPEEIAKFSQTITTSLGIEGND